jgi:N-acetylglutamate synthase-like GNAT family acetyltransferase
MRIRKALPEDIPAAIELARRLEMDYDGMGEDPLWVAQDGGRIVGLVALRTHPDCRELAALGVEPDYRGRGTAKALVEALMAEARGDVHLATVIPGFFEGCGFAPVGSDIPPSFPAKRRTDWCEGCPQERCTVMRRAAGASAARPVFPELKPVGLEDRPVFEDYLRRWPSEVCELDFANIFIWRDSEHPRWTTLNGSLCVLVEPDFEPPYFLPPVGGERVEETIAACLGIAQRLSRVPADFVARHGAGFKAEEDPGNFDYIYGRTELAELKGKKYDGKRNRIKKFETTFAHQYHYHALTRDDLPGCTRLLEDWFEEKRNGDPYMQAERLAILRALDSYEAVGLTGAVVKVGGRVEAFTMGGRLTPEMAVIPIEIANPGLVGLAQWINREFVLRAWTDVAFVNREQDMNVEGLRRAKESYQPVRLVKKYDLS